MSSMLQNLEAWAQDAVVDDEGNKTELTAEDWNSCEEVSLDQKAFAGNKISAADWKQLVTKCPAIEAFSAVESKLESVEKPSEDVEDIQVLDLSKNPIKDLAFVEGFPKLISLTMTGNSEITKVEQLAPLKKLPDLQMLELEADKTENLLGCEDEKALREKIWEFIPDLVGFNGANSDGEILDMDMNGFLEEEGMLGEEEEGMDWDKLMEEEDLEEEDFDDEDLDEEEEDEEEEDGEPEAKRSKKTE